jgi:hypothetical protein
MLSAPSRRLLWVLVVGALISFPALSIGSGVAGAQTSPPTLAGEQFAAGDPPFLNTTFTMAPVTCDPAGPSSFSYTASGTAGGVAPPPLPGNFTENGTVTFTGTSGPALLNASFTISDPTTGATLATGTKTATPGGSGVNAVCTPGSSPPQARAGGNVDYSVTFTAGGTENGVGNIGAGNGSGSGWPFLNLAGPGGAMLENFNGPGGPPPPPPGGATVTGTVTGPGGTVFQPPIPAGAEACPANEPFDVNCQGKAVASADPNQGGAYTLNLNAGSYNVAGFAFINGQVATTSVPVLVTLSPGQTVTENFTVTPPPPPPPPPPATVSGTVTGAGGTVFPSFINAGAAACPANQPPPPPGGICSGLVVAGADPTHGGAYTLTLAPGSYTVAGFAFIGGQLASTTPVPVTVSQGQTITENFTVPGAVVVGTVIGPGGTPFPPGTTNGVGACPAPGHGQGCPGLQTTFADASGHYTLFLAPGTYDLGGFAFINGTLTFSLPVDGVTLVDGQTKTENFTVLPTTVSGTVTGPGGTVFPNNPAAPGGSSAGAAACPASEPLTQTCPGLVTTPADPNHGGAYTLNLTPGSYNVEGFAILNTQTGLYATSAPVQVTLAYGDTVTKNFMVPAVDSVTLSPPSAVNPVGTSDTVTATATGGGQPVPGATILFTVQGSVSTSGSCTTAANGQCSFTYAGPQLPGADIITGTADDNHNGVADPTEPAGQATVAWVLPTTTKAITMGPQAMEGDLKVAPGSTLQVGYDFTMPGSHPAATVTFVGARVVFHATCVSGTGGATLTVPINDQAYPDAANSSAWLPSGDQSNAVTYQGSLTVPDVCNGGLVRLQQGGTFMTGITSTDTSDKVNVRWHYRDGTDSGGWSGTLGVIPS